MRAKTINEVNNFERNQEPKKAMGIGISEKLDMIKGISAFTHWLYNVHYNFVEEIWGKTHIANHFNEKWQGILSRSKEDYASPNSLMKFVRELDDENRKMLYEYIIEKHKDQWV
ncbi:MAG: hypothetical protein WC554_14995 [Clostridia bacterium]|jgi:hypothetical protein